MAWLRLVPIAELLNACRRRVVTFCSVTLMVGLVGLALQEFILEAHHVCSVNT